MSRFFFRRKDAACPASDEILLYLSGELDRRRQRRVNDHLRSCWSCIAEAERLKQGIHLFVEYKDRQLYPAIPTPPPQGRALRERLVKDRPSSSPFLTFVSAAFPSRPVWIMLTTGVIAAVLLFVAVRPGQMQAGEFTRRAALSTVAAKAKGWVHQRVKVRRGAETVYWDGWHGPNNKLIAAAGSAESWQNGLRGPLQWDDPLSADHFAVWRNQTQVSADDVTSQSELRTLRCRTSQGRIQTASLTVRAADFHPVAKRVEYTDQSTVEATEILWEYREAPQAKVEKPVLRPAEQQAIRTDGDQSDRDVLDESEIEARIVLLELRVGLTGDEPGFALIRKANTVQVEVFTSSDQRRDQIRAALASIPRVEARIAGPGDSRDGGMEAVVAEDAPEAPGAAVRKEPLLWDAILSSAGSEAQALRLTHEISSSGAALRAAVAQLHGLASSAQSRAAAGRSHVR